MPGPSSRSSRSRWCWLRPCCRGCASSAERSIAFVTPELNDAYIPLYMGTVIGSSRFAAAVVVAPNVAVTNDHNLNLLSRVHGPRALARLRPAVLPHRADARAMLIASPKSARP